MSDAGFAPVAALL